MSEYLTKLRSAQQALKDAEAEYISETKPCENV